MSEELLQRHQDLRHTLGCLRVEWCGPLQALLGIINRVTSGHGFEPHHWMLTLMNNNEPDSIYLILSIWFYLSVYICLFISVCLCLSLALSTFCCDHMSTWAHEHMNTWTELSYSSEWRKNCRWDMNNDDRCCCFVLLSPFILRLFLAHSPSVTQWILCHSIHVIVNNGQWFWRVAHTQTHEWRKQG